MKMKKIRSVLLIAAIAAGMLAGCGSGSSDTKDIRAAGEGMLQGWEDGDWDEISRYGTDELLSSSKLDTFNTERSEEDFYHEIGVSREDMDESVQEAVTKFIEESIKDFVESCEISDVSENQDENGDGTGVGTVEAKVVLDYDPDEININNNAELKQKLQELSQEYADNHREEIMQIYKDEGEEAALRSLYNEVLPDIMEIYRDVLDSADSCTETVDLTVEKQDDGTWLVSDYQEYTQDSADAAATE